MAISKIIHQYWAHRQLWSQEQNSSHIWPEYNFYTLPPGSLTIKQWRPYPFFILNFSTMPGKQSVMVYSFNCLSVYSLSTVGSEISWVWIIFNLFYHFTSFLCLPFVSKLWQWDINLVCRSPGLNWWFLVYKASRIALSLLHMSSFNGFNNTPES